MKWKVKRAYMMREDGLSVRLDMDDHSVRITKSMEFDTYVLMKLTHRAPLRNDLESWVELMKEITADEKKMEKLEEYAKESRQ